MPWRRSTGASESSRLETALGDRARLAHNTRRDKKTRRRRKEKKKIKREMRAPDGRESRENQKKRETGARKWGKRPFSERTTKQLHLVSHLWASRVSLSNRQAAKKYISIYLKYKWKRRKRNTAWIDIHMHMYMCVCLSLFLFERVSSFVPSGHVGDALLGLHWFPTT